VRAALMCTKTGCASGLIEYDSLADAFDAAQVIPCSPKCMGAHIVSWPEAGRVHAEFVGSQPAPPDLASALWAYGYRRPDGLACTPPQFWPSRRPTLNERLIR
jgi:hypothetical protein